MYHHVHRKHVWHHSLSAIQGEGGDRPSVTSSQQLLSSIQGSKACLNVFDGKPMTIWPEHASRYTILDVRGQHTPTKAYDKMQLNDYHATPAYLLLQNSENVSNVSHPKTRETNGLRWSRVPGCSQYCWRPHSCNAIHATFPSTSILLFSIQRPHRTAANELANQSIFTAKTWTLIEPDRIFSSATLKAKQI